LPFIAERQQFVGQLPRSLVEKLLSVAEPRPWVVAERLWLGDKLLQVDDQQAWLDDQERFAVEQRLFIADEQRWLADKRLGMGESWQKQRPRPYGVRRLFVSIASEGWMAS
jgi:hypothetical protein